jgi:hypothetical protein
MNRLLLQPPDAPRITDHGSRPSYFPLGTYSAQRADLARWLDGAARNTDRDLRLQYLSGEGLNRYEAPAIFGALVGAGPTFPAEAFTGTPAQLEELRQRLAARRGQY